MSLKNALGGIALISGTAIGAAVLALPVATAHLGFLSTVGLYVTCWFFMTMAALYLLEANLIVGYDTNLITMAQTTLGSVGRYITWFTYLILLYALTSAYLAGVGSWIAHGLGALNYKLSPFPCSLIATVLTMIIIFMGTAVTDWINRILMIGLVGTFCTLLMYISPNVDINLILHQSNQIDFRPIPLIITAFGSAIVIPSITEYLHGKPKQLFWVVLVGCAIPLLVYLLWEFGILGVIPMQGEMGLLDIQQRNQPVTDLPRALEVIVKNPKLTLISAYFSIFALVTSLLGVCLSLFDFLADGLKLHKTKREKLLLSAITFLPPLLFIVFYPQGFTVALSFAGIFVAILLGILPTLMVWRGRFVLNLAAPLEMLGGRPLMAVTILFFIAVIGIEVYNQYVALFHP